MKPERDSIRKLIFISHANPADNDFTAWLGSRLSAMGFDVWADLKNLKGGSRHWQEIENKIRDEAAKVLVVTTHASRDAEGVEQEINIAKGIEKEQSLHNFIIQLMVDDLPYTRLPPALNNRLAISFNKGWGNGLKTLVEQLNDEGIDRDHGPHSSTQMFSSIVLDKSDKLEDVEEPVITTWLPIYHPTELYTYKIPGEGKISTGKLTCIDIPAYAFKDYVITFAVPDTVAYALGISASDLYHSLYLSTDWLHSNNISDYPIQNRDRRIIFSGLLNSAWDIKLRSEGLVRHNISNEATFFFPSKDQSPVKQRYIDPLGRKTRPITLVGKSPKYSALWHASLSARAVLHPIPHYSTRLHVAFTDDGESPIFDGTRAFKLRKSFCKSFWNDRWRRILLSFITRISNEDGKILLETGGSDSITVCPPLILNAPYSISSDIAQQTLEEQDEDAIDISDIGIIDEDDDTED